MLEADNITLRRGNLPILQGVCLRVCPGKVTALLGPNGSGKSTLLKVLTGELSPRRGAVSWEGMPQACLDTAELARRRAVLPQASALGFDFAVEEVVLMGRAPHRRFSNPGTDLTIACQALESVGMLALRNRLYTTLSGGEQQRVHLARVLAQLWDAPADAPRYLFLDEPTSNLDLKHQHAVLHLARAWAQAGTAVLVVLHDLNLALRYTDVALLLRGGRSAGFGPAAAMLTPARIRHVFDVEAELAHLPGSPVPVITTFPAGGTPSRNPTRQPNRNSHHAYALH